MKQPTDEPRSQDSAAQNIHPSNDKRQWETPDLRSLELEETKLGISTIADAEGLEAGSA